jgi:hypothetical protein
MRGLEDEVTGLQVAGIDVRQRDGIAAAKPHGTSVKH